MLIQFINVVFKCGTGWHKIIVGTPEVCRVPCQGHRSRQKRIQNFRRCLVSTETNTRSVFPRYKGGHAAKLLLQTNVNYKMETLES